MLILPGYLNKLPGFSSTQTITKIVAYPGTKYSKLLTLNLTLYSYILYLLLAFERKSECVVKVIETKLNNIKRTNNQQKLNKDFCVLDTKANILPKVKGFRVTAN